MKKCVIFFLLFFFMAKFSCHISIEICVLHTLHLCIKICIPKVKKPPDKKGYSHNIYGYTKKHLLQMSISHNECFHREIRKIFTFWLKKHIQYYGHCHIFFHKYHISLTSKCLTCIYKWLSGSVVQLLPLGLQITGQTCKPLHNYDFVSQPSNVDVLLNP